MFPFITLIILIGITLFAYSASKVLGIFVGLIACWIGCGMVGLIIADKLYTKEGRERQRIKSKIAKLKNKATEKKIIEKAIEVFIYMGKGSGNDRNFTDDKIRISSKRIDYRERDLFIEIPKQKEWQIVYYANRKEERDYEFVKTTLEPTGTDGYELSEGFTYEKDLKIIVEVQSYIPGEWEKHLNRLYSKTKKIRKELEKKERENDIQKEIEDSKKKFGL